MATVTASMSNEYLEMYKGYTTQAVGLGVADPNIYASDAYRRKKIKNMLIGGISKIRYAGSEHDLSPTVLTIGYEPAYATVLGYNLRYVPVKTRKAIMEYVLDTNKVRIKSNQPIIVDYEGLKRKIPETRFILRRYKTIGVNLIETVPLTEWAEIAKERSNWESHYRVLANEAKASNERNRKRRK